MKPLDILSRCSVCEAIKIAGAWMGKEDNPGLYQRYIEKYTQNGKGISNTYCPEHKKEIMKVLDIDDLKNSEKNLENKADIDCWPLEADPRIFN